MTAKKDLKRRIRERQQKTGESYVAARRAVLAEAEPPPQPAGFPAPSLREAMGIVPELQHTAQDRIEVVEMDDVTDAAAALGLKCTISITHALLEQVDAQVVLARFRDVLLGTTADPGMESLRAVALRGEAVPKLLGSKRWYEELQHFAGRVRVGIGGVSDGGTMLAMQLEGKRGLVMMVCHLGFGIVMPRDRPRVVLTTAEAAAFYIEPIAMRGLRK